MKPQIKTIKHRNKTFPHVFQIFSYLSRHFGKSLTFLILLELNSLLPGCIKLFLFAFQLLHAPHVREMHTCLHGTLRVVVMSQSHRDGKEGFLVESMLAWIHPLELVLAGLISFGRFGWCLKTPLGGGRIMLRAGVRLETYVGFHNEIIWLTTWVSSSGG